MKLTGVRLERFTSVLANETEKDERANDFLARGGSGILAIAEAHAVAVEGDLEGSDKAVDFVLIWGYEGDDSTKEHVEVVTLPVDTDRGLPCNRPQSIMWYHEDVRYPERGCDLTTVTHVVITGSKSLSPPPFGPVRPEVFYALYCSPIEEEMEHASEQELSDTERWVWLHERGLACSTCFFCRLCWSHQVLYRIVLDRCTVRPTWFWSAVVGLGLWKRHNTTALWCSDIPVAGDRREYLQRLVVIFPDPPTSR